MPFKREEVRQACGSPSYSNATCSLVASNQQLAARIVTSEAYPSLHLSDMSFSRRPSNLEMKCQSSTKLSQLGDQDKSGSCGGSDRVRPNQWKADMQGITTDMRAHDSAFLKKLTAPSPTLCKVVLAKYAQRKIDFGYVSMI